MTYHLDYFPSDTDDGFDDSWDDHDMRAPALTLSAEQQSSLAEAVCRSLDERGCDHTLRAARQWALDAGVDWPSLQTQLEDNGGYCDCEVLRNVIVVGEDEAEPD
jgi:hypothetical protein